MARNLVQVINSSNPNLDNSTVEQLAECFAKYNIAWVELAGEPIFYCQNLSEAKGLTKGDFVDNYMPKLVAEGLTEHAVSNTVSSTATKYCLQSKVQLIKLKGNAWKQLKQLFGSDIINKYAKDGLFCYWETAFHYLSQGHGKTAKEVNKIGADAVVKQTKQEVAAQLFSNTENQTYEESGHSWDKPCPERLLQSVIIELASYGCQHFIQEFCFPTEGRADLVSLQGNKVFIYELKATQLTSAHIQSKVKYIAAMQQRYPNMQVNLVFVSCCGCSVEAEYELVRQSELGLTVKYIPYVNIISAIINKALAYQAVEGHWFIKPALLEVLRQLPTNVVPPCVTTPLLNC